MTDDVGDSSGMEGWLRLSIWFGLQGIPSRFRPHLPLKGPKKMQKFRYSPWKKVLIIFMKHYLSRISKKRHSHFGYNQDRETIPIVICDVHTKLIIVGFSYWTGAWMEVLPMDDDVLSGTNQSDCICNGCNRSGLRTNLSLTISVPPRAAQPSCHF